MKTFTRRQLLQHSAYGIGALAFHDLARAADDPLAARLSGHKI